MSGKRITYNIPGVPADTWPEDAGLGLPAHEAFRCTTLLEAVPKPWLGGWAGKAEAASYEEALRSALADPLAAQQIPELLKATAGIDLFIQAVRERKGKVRGAERALKKAGDIGTAAHAWIQWHVTNAIAATDPKRQPDQEAEPELADRGALLRDGFLEWAKLSAVTFRKSELEVHSARDRWAGTLDILARLGKRVTVVDAKSAAGIYREHLMQVSAYCVAVQEMGITRTLPQGLILRLPKTAEDFDATLEKNGVPYEVRIIEGEDVIEHYAAFLASKHLWEQLRRLDRAAKEEKA